jgi:hypothetical protein
MRLNLFGYATGIQRPHFVRTAILQSRPFPFRKATNHAFNINHAPQRTSIPIIVKIITDLPVHACP